RFTLMLLAIFAGVALILAAVGIYGVVSYSVTEHARDFSIRFALGAQRSEVLRLVLLQGLRMAAAGVAIGTATALALTRLMVKLLYGVSRADPATFAGVAVALASVALAACLIPAIRATHADPIRALRIE